MALRDKATFGMSLPHRSPDPIDVSWILSVAQRSEALGYTDLWVTENVLDSENYAFDPITILTYAAAVTTRIHVGVSVVVLPLRSPLHVAHSYGSLDYISNGRAILGVGLGRTGEYAEFGVPTDRRVRRFLEQIRLIKALWTEDDVRSESDMYHINAGIKLRPVKQPHPPIWLGGGHPDAVRRAATVADGWMGAGGQTTQGFKESVPVLKQALEQAGEDPEAYPISKRVFMSVHEDAATARDEVARWYTQVYHNAAATDTSGVHGTPELVREQLEALIDAGANHLLLNPVCRYEEQVDALAEVVGLK